jgi:hypothetical protein
MRIISERNVHAPVFFRRARFDFFVELIRKDCSSEWSKPDTHLLVGVDFAERR